MEERFRQLKQYIYYIIIFVISFITLVFLPMIGTDLNVGFSLPTTPAAWTVFIVTKSITAVVNVLLFYCFNQQAIINISNDPRYIKAREMLSKDDIKKEYKPRSPRQYNFQLYGGKGTSIFFSSILSTFAISQAILTYDWISLLSYALVITFGVIFGINSMLNTERYYTEELPLYVQMVTQQKENLNKENNQHD